MTAKNPLPSQTSSHAKLEPTSGTTLLHAELTRRATLRPLCATGCRELDEATLVSGGFERGCVVGLSAEEDDVALVLGLQTIARLLDGEGAARAMIVTTMSVGSLVGLLREVLRAQGGGARGREAEAEVLGRVAVSRVFDVNGLWEVLSEVDAVGGSQEVGEGVRTPEAGEGIEDEDGLGCVVTPARECRPGGEGTPAARTKASGVDEEGQQVMDVQHADEADSSPLSDPPSSLPDIAPWDAVEAELDPKGTHTDEARTDETGTGEGDWSRRTPPGQREEIQDSEEEEGFSSPLAPSQSSTKPSRVKLPELQSETEDTIPIHEATLQPDPYDMPSHSSNSLSPRSSLDAAGTPKLDQEDGLARPAMSSIAQDGKDDIQQKAHVSEPVDGEKPPPSPSSCKAESTPPDIILITHMSTLLSSLFHQREKATAHQTLQLLASHLRYLTRSMDHGGPLIMILNSTTSSESNVAAPAHDQDRDGAPRPPPARGPPTPHKSLDPTLRSIFNPPPLPASGLLYTYDTPHSRRNKPSFGLIFTQLLDLHLLCIKIPKTRADAEALYAPASPGKVVAYVWAVEVLMDEIGVWEGRERVLEGKPRRFREQRWGAVEVRRDSAGMRIADAFEKKAQSAPQQIVVSAGFGGPRV